MKSRIELLKFFWQKHKALTPLVAILLLVGCMSSYTIKTTYVNKSTDSETKIIETEQTIKGRPSIVFTFYTRTFKFLKDNLK